METKPPTFVTITCPETKQVKHILLKDTIPCKNTADFKWNFKEEQVAQKQKQQPFDHRKMDQTYF